METKEKEIICLDKLETVRGSQTEEQYYKEYEELGLLDTEEHLLEGGRCRDCGYGTLRFWKYQPGPFGNRVAVYTCDDCNEYTLAALRK